VKSSTPRPHQGLQPSNEYLEQAFTKAHCWPRRDYGSAGGSPIVDATARSGGLQLVGDMRRICHDVDEIAMKTVQVRGGLGLPLENIGDACSRGQSVLRHSKPGGFWPNAAGSTPGTHTFTMEDSSTRLERAGDSAPVITHRREPAFPKPSLTGCADRVACGAERDSAGASSGGLGDGWRQPIAGK
jgi:hypothetical protein